MEIKYFFCILQFTDDADSVGGNSLESLTAKDLTKYVYGVAKGMEYIVSKGVRSRTLQGDPSAWDQPPIDLDLGCSAILPG